MHRTAGAAAWFLMALLGGCSLGGDSWTAEPDPALTGVNPLSRLITLDDLSAATVGGCTGVVNDSSGAPASGVELELKRIEGPQYVGPTATANSDGEFGFADVPPGQFTIDIRDGTTVRSQACAIEADYITRVDVGPNGDGGDDTPSEATPGFGELEPYLPAPGDVAVFERTLIDGEGDTGTITLTYGQIDMAAGTLAFDRQFGDVTESVTQCYEVDGGRVYLAREVVGDWEAVYTSGMLVYHDGSAGPVLPADVRGTEDGTSIHYRLTLTALDAEDVTVGGEPQSTIGFESYLTELASATPKAVVAVSRYAPGSWCVQRQTEVSGGSADQVRGTVLDTLVSYTPG